MVPDDADTSNVDAQASEPEDVAGRCRCKETVFATVQGSDDFEPWRDDYQVFVATKDP